MRMLYICTHMATQGVRGLNLVKYKSNHLFWVLSDSQKVMCTTVGLGMVLSEGNLVAAVIGQWRNTWR